LPVILLEPHLLAIGAADLRNEPLRAGEGLVAEAREEAECAELARITSQIED
jgi:hypothetical protein